MINQHYLVPRTVEMTTKLSKPVTQICLCEFNIKTLTLYQL